MRCSLREPHARHAYTASGQSRVCGGGSPEQPRPAVLMEYVFSLDGRGRRVRLSLPEDLTARDAERLAAMLGTLPIPERP